MIQMGVRNKSFTRSSTRLRVQVMIEAASSEEQKTAEYRTRKLESLERQNELIEEENRKREEVRPTQPPSVDKFLTLNVFFDRL